MFELLGLHVQAKDALGEGYESQRSRAKSRRQYGTAGDEQ
jgi:hypothetical protein